MILKPLINNRTNNSLAHSFVVYILLFSSFAALISTSVQLFFEYKRDVTILEEMASQIEASHKSTITQALWAYDVMILDSQLRGIKTLPGVLYAGISKDGQIIRESGTLPPNRTILSYNFPLIHKVKSQKIDLGTLEVKLNLSGVYARLLDRVVVILAVQTLKTFLVSLFILFLFHMIVGRHLTSMAKFTERIHLNSLDTPFRLNRKGRTKGEDELGLVEQALNQMRLKLLDEMTTLERTRSALEESEERFKALHNASFGGIVIHDMGRIIECNQGLSDITGYSYDELIGMDGSQLISHNSREIVINNINTGYEKPYEVTGLRKNKEEYPVRIEARNIPYKGKNVGVVEFRDISETKKAEEDKEKLEHQLQQSQKMEAIGRLAGGVAHDFNNMLGVILGHTEMIKEGIDSAHSLHNDLDEIHLAAKRSVDLTRQLLAFARRQPISPRILDLNKTVAGMTKMLERVIGEEITLTWAPCESPGLVEIDPGQLDQILVNLCVNAKDAIDGTGIIIIETDNISFDPDYCANHSGFTQGDYVRLAVSDNGAGMTADTLKNIFEPFFTTKAPGKGTGLGLSTVYGAVKQNKGFINVYSEPGNGTAVKIYLPRCDTEAADAKAAPENIQVPGGYETILLVEDEVSILRMTRMMLERMGYRVISARTPGEAVVLSRQYQGKIHMLMTDVVMPEMNGRDLAGTILGSNPDMKCLFMSGYTADVIAHHGILDSGINFIQKPFSKKQLSLKLREVLGS